MRSHASQTAAILSRIGVMADMATIAASHHERLDGKGYPLQLDSRLISLETRIITVADFFDAVTAARPYRDAMPLDRALAIMRNEVGGALDATVFAALEAITANGIPEMPLPEIGGAFLLR
jgi:HD-GYP domain-containing protein (c-di-GMP phosphodiesterase class II)